MTEWREVARRDQPKAMKILVGNLAVQTTQAELKELFAGHGKVRAVHLPVAGKFQSACGCVTMATAEEVDAAMEALDGFELHGRKLALKTNQTHE